MNSTGQRTICAADITPIPVEWLWKGWLPRGKLVILQGNAGTGKTTIAIDIIARLSSGMPLPDGSVVDPLHALVLNTEDGNADTLVPRLDAAGANKERVHFWNFDTSMPSLASGATDLMEEVRRLNAGLVVLDPLSEFFGRDLNSNSDQDVRLGLQPMTQLAQETGVTFLALRHLRKTSGTAMDKGLGSTGIGAVSRSVILAGKRPGSESEMVMAPVKMNLCKNPLARLYEVKGSEGQPRISWGATCGLLADDLVAEEVPAHGKLGAAKDWLKDVLSTDPIPASELEDLIKGSPHSQRTVERARADLNVVPYRNGAERMVKLPDNG